jgi:UPF0716 family protein affecting phage T7 exclusion
MRRLRIYSTSAIAGLAGAVAVFWISARIERQQAGQEMARMREHMDRVRDAPQGSLGAVAGGVAFGPGIFTLFLAVLAFAAIFYCLYRWQASRSTSAGN